MQPKETLSVIELYRAEQQKHKPSHFLPLALGRPRGGHSANSLFRLICPYFTHFTPASLVVFILFLFFTLPRPALPAHLPPVSCFLNCMVRLSATVRAAWYAQLRDMAKRL